MKRIALAFLLLCPGCMRNQLRTESVRLSATTNDLIYEQVLNNVARTVSQPADFPYFNMPASGTAQIQQQLTATLTPQWAIITAANSVHLGSWLFNQTQLAVAPSQIDQESWQLSPVGDPDRLALMHAAYLKVTGQESPESEHILHEYYSARDGWVDIAEQQVHFSNTVWGMSHKLISLANEALAGIPCDPKDFGSQSAYTPVLSANLRHQYEGTFNIINDDGNEDGAAAKPKIKMITLQKIHDLYDAYVAAKLIVRVADDGKDDLSAMPPQIKFATFLKSVLKGEWKFLSDRQTYFQIAVVVALKDNLCYQRLKTQYGFLQPTPQPSQAITVTCCTQCPPKAPPKADEGKAPPKADEGKAPPNTTALDQLVAVAVGASVGRRDYAAGDR